MQLGAEKSGSYGSHGASGPSRWLKLAILPPCAMAPARDSAIIPAAFVPVCSAVVTSKPGARVGQWASRRRRAATGGPSCRLPSPIAAGTHSVLRFDAKRI